MYGDKRYVRYSHLAFGYILRKVKYSIGWRVASEGEIEHCVRLSYSHLAFGYILRKVKYSIGW